MIDYKTVSTAYVFKNSTQIGRLERSAYGAVFYYLSNVDQTQQLCYSMPATRPSYEVRGYNLHPFFAGLLPEGLRLKALRQVLKTSEDDLFTLLIGSAGDLIGDITLSASEELPDTPKIIKEDIEQVSFEELFNKCITADTAIKRSIDLGAAGVQPKISSAMISFPINIKIRKRPGILKLCPSEFPSITRNEFFFIKMAKACGLQVPSCELVKDRTGAIGLLLERFDRKKDQVSKKIIQIHQEDACQFLNRYPADKYRLGFNEITEALASFSTAPMIEIAKLIRLKAFSYLITNGDLHAKNISLFSNPTNMSIQLTPAYDLVATWPYGDRTMALQFEGRNDNIKAQDFINFGARYGLREVVITKILEELVKNASPWIERLSEIGLDDKQTSELRKVMIKRIGDLTLRTGVANAQ